MRTFLRSKLHRIKVTDAHLDYVGSVALGGKIMDDAEIATNEQVDVINLNNGERWTTYAIRHDDDFAFTLNGGGARLGLPGDVCVVMTYQTVERQPRRPRVLFFSGDWNGDYRIGRRDAEKAAWWAL